MKIFTVDAFTDKPFTGNPACVCILDESIPEELYLLIAREINYSETAFVLENNGKYEIRWFTPKVEVNLCGHATLAAAHVLYELGYCIPENYIVFVSQSGLLSARKIGDQIELDFPQIFVEETESNDIIEKAFNIKPVYIGKNDNRYLIEIDNYEELLSIKPDIQLLKSCDLGRFILTVKSPLSQYDFISRYFAPGVGVPEDPVTGTAHCYLSPYWGEKLRKTKMTGFQASERSGTLECELVGDNRVKLRANSVIMNEMIPKWNLK